MSAPDLLLPGEKLLAGLLAPRVDGLTAPIQWDCDALLPPEKALVARAVGSRQREFSTGRVLARRLLEQRGVRDFPLLRDADRVPIWPCGIVGCISHTGDLAVTVVASSAEYLGIGIDVERDEPVERGIERIVCRKPEQAWIAEASGSERGRRCKIVFSIKEAVYKAFFPSIRTFWSFQDVGVEIDLARNGFEARLPPSAGLERIEGRLARRSGWVLASVCIEKPHDSEGCSVTA